MSDPLSLQVTPVTRWGEADPSDATEAVVIAESPLRPVLLAALPPETDVAELLYALKRGGWDSLWALRSRWGGSATATTTTMVEAATSTGTRSTATTSTTEGSGCMVPGYVQGGERCAGGPHPLARGPR